MAARTANLFVFFFFVFIPATILQAESQVRIEVKTVLASQEAKYHDPQLSNLINELQSVFRYTSYRLLSQNRLSLATGQTGMVRLPGRRVLKITPAGVRGGRAELRLAILKNKNAVFQTVIRLRNQSSITVGGPKHQKGYLLFNIFASY